MRIPYGCGLSDPAPETAAWRRVRVTDSRTGRALCVTHRESEPFWPDAWGAQAAETWSRLARFHSSRGAEVLCGPIPEGGTAYFVKVFTPRGFRDRLSELVPYGRARRAWRHALQAARLGFRVIRPACLLTRPYWTWRGSEALVTCAETGAEPLSAWLRAMRKAPGEQRLSRRLALDALGREVARWHAAGLVHGDLNLGNLLVRCERAGPTFTWLDIESNRHWPLGVPLRWRAKNLTDLNYERHLLSRTDRMRIWKAYVGESGLSPVRAGRLLRLVLERTAHRWRKRGWIS